MDVFNIHIEFDSQVFRDTVEQHIKEKKKRTELKKLNQTYYLRKISPILHYFLKMKLIGQLIKVI